MTDATPPAETHTINGETYVKYTDYIIERANRISTLAILRQRDWQPIETAPYDRPVELWRDGEHLVGYKFDAACNSWSKKQGFPAFWNVLTVQPTHWREMTEGPR